MKGSLVGLGPHQRQELRGKGPEKTFFKKRYIYTNGQKVNEKKLNIISHGGYSVCSVVSNSVNNFLLFSHKNERSITDMFHNMDEPQQHYAK